MGGRGGSGGSLPRDPTLGGAAGLSAQARACLAAGCRAIYYYNYGLLTPDRLGWVAQANRGVGG